MNLIHPDVSLVPMCKRLAAPNLKYWLFSFTGTIDRETVLADVQDGNQQGPVSVDDSDFTTEGVADHRGTILAPPIAITNTSGAPYTAQGYYVTDAAETSLLAVAKFDTAVVVGTGGVMLVTPVLGDSSRYSS